MLINNRNTFPQVVTLSKCLVRCENFTRGCNWHSIRKCGAIEDRVLFEISK